MYILFLNCGKFIYYVYFMVFLFKGIILPFLRTYAQKKASNFYIYLTPSHLPEQFIHSTRVAVLFLIQSHIWGCIHSHLSNKKKNFFNLFQCLVAFPIRSKIMINKNAGHIYSHLDPYLTVFSISPYKVNLLLVFHKQSLLCLNSFLLFLLKSFIKSSTELY